MRRPPEMFYGFLLPNNAVIRHPNFAQLMKKYQDKELSETRACGLILQAMAWKLQTVWHRVRLESTSSGTVIVLADNTSDDTIIVPLPEVIKGMQDMMRFPEEIKAKWMRVHTA